MLFRIETAAEVVTAPNRLYKSSEMVRQHDGTCYVCDTQTGDLKAVGSYHKPKEKQLRSLQIGETTQASRATCIPSRGQM